MPRDLLERSRHAPSDLAKRAASLVVGCGAGAAGVWLFLQPRPQELAPLPPMVVTEVRQPAADPAQAPADSTAPPVSYAPAPDLDPASIALIPRSGPQGPAAPAMLAPPAPTQPPPPTPSSRTTLKPAVSPASKPASDAKAKPPTPGLIQLDINSATQSQLEQLPGIGPALAQRIVEYRTQKGRFTRVEDLDAVKGIGPKLLEKIRPHVTVK